MSIATLKAQVQAQIIDKDLIPDSISASTVGDNINDLADEVVALFTALNGGTLPADQDTIYKITQKIIGINSILGVSGTTIDSIVTALGNKDDGSAVDTKIAAAVANLLNSAPGALDTLKELATALGNDPNYATTITGLLAGKEPTIAAGSAGQYYKWNKTWGSFSADVIASTLAGYVKAATAAAFAAGDTILVMFGKAEKRIELIETLNVTAKTTLADTDQIAISDGALKRITWANFKAALSLITTPLTGFVTAAASASITATTNILQAFQLIQKRLELLEAGDDLLSYFNPAKFFMYDSGGSVMKMGIRTENRLMEFLKALNFAYKGETLLGTYEECVANALNSGATRYSLMKIEADSVITELGICMRTAAVFTTSSGNNKLWLYKVDLTAKTASLVAQSADTPGLFNSAGIRRAALTAPYSAAAGYYLLAVRYETTDQTTPGTILSKVLDGSTMAIIDNLRLAGTASTLSPATVDMQTLNASSASTWGFWN